MTREKTLLLTKMGIMTAVSVVLVALVHFPLIPAAAFLEYDPADIPIFITTFALGPLAGLCVTVIAALVQGLTVSSSSGVSGILMHIISTGSFVLVAGNIYKTSRTMRTAVLSLSVGVLAATAIMLPANLIITPLFMGVGIDAVVQMLVPIILPFNLLKFTLNAALTLVLYKRISGFLKK
ncbi:MAG: ECF transporter S component [Clostridia bacterium]|nr:ECF transporter S component [Clostridia bacterium]